MVKSYFPITLVFILSTVGLSQNSTNHNSLNEKSKIVAAQRYDSLFNALFKEKGFNGNVLIAQNGDVVYKNAFGYSDLKAKKPLIVESTFQIASITKQFTAMAIMMLYEKGELSFTDPVQYYFPNFPYKGITIHHLLTHRSGLPEYMRFARKYWKNKSRLMKNKDVMEMLVTYKPKLLFTPDSKYKYNNTGYVILACIIEKVSSKPYHAFIKENIFNKLQMKNSYIYPFSDIKKPDLKTIGHKKNKRKAKEDYLSGVVGDKGIYSTIEDMFKWDQALYTEKLVKQKTLEEAFTPKSFDPKRKNSYGYGWRIDSTEDGSKVVYHGGWWRGYNSLFVRRITDKTSFIILCNRVNTSFEDIQMLMGIIDSSKYNVDIQIQE